MGQGQLRVRVGVSTGHASAGPAGPRRYARALCDALRELPHIEVVELPTPRGSPITRRLWDLFGVGMLARRHSVDLVHCTGIYAPLVATTPVVLTVHDLAIRHVPDAFPPMNRRIGWPIWSFLARRASHLIAISETTRRDLVDCLGLPPERVSVVRHGVGDPFGGAGAAEVERVRHVYTLNDDYFLVVGTIEPRKNLARTLEAFRLVRRSGCEAQLAIVGGPGWGQAEQLQQLASGALGAAVHYLGPVPDADLAALYRAAVGLVYPSLYEGFGLPVLEAMASGCPVVASARGGLAEAAGDAAVLVDPLSVSEIAAAMQALLTDSAARTELVRRGRERAAGFTWRWAAEQTLEVYRGVLAGSLDG